MLPLMLLAIASVFVGYVGKDMIIGVGSAFWGNSLSMLSRNVMFVDAEYLPYHIKIIPLIFSHLGIFFAYNLASIVAPGDQHQRSMLFHMDGEPGLMTRIHRFFSHCRNFNDSHNRFIVYEVISFGHRISFRLFDAGWIAYLGPYGIAKTIEALARGATRLQTGYVYHYAYIILAGTVLFALGVIYLQPSTQPLIFVYVLTCLYILRERI